MYINESIPVTITYAKETRQTGGRSVCGHDDYVGYIC